MSKVTTVPAVTFDVHEIHIQNNIITWEFADKVYMHFAYNPYSGAVTFRSSAINHVFNVGKAHSIGCARKLVKWLCQKDQISVWIAPTDAQLDRGHTGEFMNLKTPDWSEGATFGTRPGQHYDARTFCKCGECPMPESFRWTDYPCTVSCSGYLLAG